MNRAEGAGSWSVEETGLEAKYILWQQSLLACCTGSRRGGLTGLSPTPHASADVVRFVPTFRTRCICVPYSAISMLERAVLS